MHNPMTDLIQDLIHSYPRTRVPLPDCYQKVFHTEILAGRQGRSLGHRLVLWAESWMHHQVAISTPPGRILELGAGTLNHLNFERNYLSYDVVEPYDYDYRNIDQVRINKIRSFYKNLNEVPILKSYDRVISVAVLEHLENLPAIIARCGLILKDHGIFQAGIPCEGEFLWHACSTLSTGILFRLRTGLPYRPFLKYEHINTADEVIALTCYFFEKVTVKRFPISIKGAGIYCYIEAHTPRLERCNQFHL